jgi:VWFA-related protein
MVHGRSNAFPLLLALLLALPGPVAAQPRQQATAQKRPAAPPAPPETNAGDETFYDTVEVNVVNLEVFVTDRNGKRVQGLNQSDFEVYEDGKPVQITNFYASEGGSAAAPAGPDDTVQAAPAAPAVTTEIPDEQRLLLAIFIDNMHLSGPARNRVLPKIKELLTTRMRPGDRVLIANYDGPGSLAVRQPLTSDPAALTAEIDQIASRAAGAATGGGEVTNLVRQLEQAGAMSSDPLRVEDEMVAQAEELLEEIKVYSQKEYIRTRATIDALSQFVDGLSGVPGRKAVLFVSGGMPLRPAQAPYQAWENRFRSILQDHPIGSRFDAIDYDATSDFEKVGQHANANRITFYALGSLDTRQTASAASGSNDIWTRGEEMVETNGLGQSLFMMAAPTGGMATIDAINPGAILAQMREDMDSYYSLGYTPEHRHSGKVHKVEVKVKQAGLKVRHRESYRERTSAEVMADKVMAALMFGSRDNPLEVGLQFGEETPGEKGQSMVMVTVKLPMSKLVLLPQGQFHEGKVSIFLAARDANGRSSPVTEVEVPIRVPNEQLLTAMGQLAGYRTKLALRPLAHTVAVGVRDELGNVSSTVTAAYTPGQGPDASPAAPATGSSAPAAAPAAPADSSASGDGNLQ